jgi:tRNA (guanine-N7-)-methyltransferase
MTKERLIRSFGRIKSRKLSDHRQDLYDNLLRKYEFDLKNKDFLTKKPLILEVGFGFGDFTFEFAKNNQEANLIAGETHINGIVNLLSKLEVEPLDNVKIYEPDIRLLLEELDDNIFDKIYILFPDPWPKSKHYKRRLINNVFIDMLSKKIKKNGKLIIATDHDSYKEWIMSVMINREDFLWNASKASDWKTFPDDWICTKYQHKALREGRDSIYLEFQNVSF